MANEEMKNSSHGVVLVGWDGSDHARDALALAGVLARERGLRVRVAQAYLGRDHAPPQFADLLQEDAGKRLTEAPLELLGEVDSEVGLAPGKSPAQALQREAERCGAAMVVLGSTHRGTLGRVAPGSVAEHLLHGAPCAVAVAPVGYAGSGPSAPRVIAVAFDASAESRAAVAWASSLGLEERAALKVISVVEPINRAFAMAAAGYYVELPDQEWREQCRKALSELVDSLPSELRAEERLRSGDAAEEILAECESGVDLLVVGSRGYGAVRRALLGSVSAKLIRSAPCPVVVVPGTKNVGAGKAERELAASR